MASPTLRYHAFISYARQDNREQGRHWAAWVHQAIETFEVPASIAGRRTPMGPVPDSLAPAYLSTSEPSVDGSLDAATKEALEESRVLIVVCSPRAAASRQVAEEVRHFKQLGRERIMALLIAGDPEAGDEARALQCYPDTLRHDVRRDGSLDREWRVHPAAADARGEAAVEGYTSAAALREALENDGMPREKATGRATAYAAKLEAARRKIIAGVLGVPLPALAGDGPAGALRAARIGQRILFGTMLLIMAVARAACWCAWNKNEQAIEADISRRRTEGIIKNLQSELTATHAGARQMQLLAGANQVLIEHFSLASARAPEPGMLNALADALGQGSEIATARTDHGRAMQLAREAIEARERAEGGPPTLNAGILTAIADQQRFAKALRKGEKRTEAIKAAEKAHHLATDLAQANPNDAAATLTAVETGYELGEMHLLFGRQDDAKKIVDQGHAAATKLLGGTNDLRARRALARAESQLGRWSQQKGDFPTALGHFRAWEAAIAPLVQASPSDTSLQEELATAKNWTGSALSLMRKFSEAAVVQREALELWDGLARIDAGNPAMQSEYITSLRRLAESLISAGPENRTEVLTLVQRGLDQVSIRFPEKTDVQGTVLRADLERVQKQATQ